MSSGSSDAIRAAALALACFTTAPFACGAGVFAQPASLYLSAEAGGETGGDIALSPTSERASVSIALSAFTIDEHGQPRSCECELTRSIRSWGDVSEHRLTLTAERRESVALHLTVPRGAAGSYWGAVMIEIDGTAPRGAVRVRSRLAIPVFVTVRGTERAAAAVDALEAFTTADGGIVVEGRIANRGNVVIRAPITIVVESGPASEPIELASGADDVVVLPEAQRIFRLTVNGAFGDPSRLRVTAWLRYASGSADLAEDNCPVSADPPCLASACRGT